MYETAIQRYEDARAKASDPFYLARYSDNHDEGRGLFRYGPGATRAINNLLCLLPHSLPFFLSGQEFGALNRPSIHERIQACDKGRRIIEDLQVIREPGVEFEGNLFARGAKEQEEWHRFYRELVSLRHATPALTHGELEWIDSGEVCAPNDRTVVAFSRKLGDTTLHCAVNMGPQARILANARVFQGKPVLGDLNQKQLEAFSAIVASA